MHLSQFALFRLCCASFLAGIFLSLFCDVLATIRIWFTPSQLRYTISKIQRMRAFYVKKKDKKQPKGIKIAVFFEDVFFCLVCAITLILLLFWLNDGAFRAAAPLCMTIGFYLCHITVSKGARIVLQWVTFGIETLLRTLCFPIKKLIVCAIVIYRKSAQRRRAKRLEKQRQIYTYQAIQSIEKTAKKLLPDDIKNRIQKGDNRAGKSKKAV